MNQNPILKKRYFLIIFSLIFIITACKENGLNEGNVQDCQGTTPSVSVNKIMPLGASRVEGARPEFESYRYELWKLLVNGGWKFDFIGTMCDEAAYPGLRELVFDRNHEGRGGWTSGQILSGLDAWIRDAGAPDIVLFSSPGGNDALGGMSYQQAIANVNAIIDALQASNPNVTILIEQMAPARSDQMTPELTGFFEQMQQDVVAIAANQSDSLSKVIPVDMATGFSDSLLADDVHYNEGGASFIANRYFEVLVNVLEP